MQGTTPANITSDDDAGARNLFVEAGIFFLLTTMLIVAAAAVWLQSPSTPSTTREGPWELKIPTQNPIRPKTEPPRTRQSGEAA